MKKYSILFLLFVLVVAACTPNKSAQKFTFKETQQGLEVFEEGQPVFFYQRTPKSSDGRFLCNNYIHPLYSLNGDTLTEEFPADHPYHRGIFCAWHQMFVGGKSVGDGWFMSDVKLDVKDVQVVEKEEYAQLKISSMWKSPLFEDEKYFLIEETDITIFPKQENYRVIDFAITLNALVQEVEIGGVDDEKGYGGFCARLSDQKLLAFTSPTGEITPQLTQVDAGVWMDFSGPHGQNEEISGVTILSHPQIPNYPAPWILRNLTSMQNVVYPGRDRVTVPMDKPIKLFYRLIVHEGNAQSIDIEKLHSDYEKENLK